MSNQKQFSCKKNVLAPYIGKAARSVSNRPTLEIMGCVKIQIAKKGDIVITGTDNETEIMAKTMIDPIDGKGFSFCVPAKKLDSLLMTLPDDQTINFRIVNEGVREILLIECGTAQFELVCWPVSDFPSTEKLGKGMSIMLPQKKFTWLLSKVNPFMANQDVRYYLNGIKLEFLAGQMNAIATDGHRLGICNFDDLDIPENFTAECILPRQAVMEIPSILASNPDGECKLAIYENHFRVITKDVVLTTKLIDGRYPDWRRIIPNTDNTMSVDKGMIFSVLKRAAVLSNEKFKGVKLTLEGSSVTVSSANEAHEKGSESISATFVKQLKSEVGYNINYLLDALSCLSGNVADFNIVSDGLSNSSTIITSDASPELTYIVMPIRL